MSRPPFSVPVNRAKCAVSLAIVAPLGVAHLWLLGQLWMNVTMGETALWLALIIGPVIALVLLLAYVPMGVLALVMLRLPGPAIVIGPDGLKDRRLSPDTVSWDRIRWTRMGFRGFNQVTRTRHHMGGVVFRVDGPFRASVLFWPVAAVYRLIAPHPWPVMTFGTDITAEKLASAMTRYRAPELFPNTARTPRG